jgi:hypothetical protein
LAGFAFAAATADRTFLEALAVFEALWHQACLLNPDCQATGVKTSLPTSMLHAC